METRIKRSRLKFGSLTLAIFLFTSWGALHAALNPSAKPNIIVILADDMGLLRPRLLRQ